MEENRKNYINFNSMNSVMFANEEDKINFYNSILDKNKRSRIREEISGLYKKIEEEKENSVNLLNEKIEIRDKYDYYFQLIGSKDWKRSDKRMYLHERFIIYKKNINKSIKSIKENKKRIKELNKEL